jgi:hypothetical protein
MPFQFQAAAIVPPSVSELKEHLVLIQQQFAHIQQTKQHFEQSITVAQLKHDPKIKADWHKLKFQTESLRLQEIDLIQHLNPGNGIHRFIHSFDFFKIL